MKKIIFTYATLLVLLGIFQPTYAASPKPATESAEIDPETIKENIKKRIEQAAKNQPEDVKKKTAFLGILSSITTNSFTLETDQGGAKQASTSATTTVLELPKNKEIKFADVSIGDHITALGFINETTKVLDARRILVLKEPPIKSTRKTAFGNVTGTDPKKLHLTVNNLATNESTTFKINSKTNLTLSDVFARKVKTDIKTITLNSQVIVIYEPSENEKDFDLATTILLKSDFPVNEATASASPAPSAPSPKNL